MPVWLQALSDDLLSEGGQALSSLTEQVVLRLQQLVRRDTKKGFFRPWVVHRLGIKPWTFWSRIQSPNRRTTRPL